MVEFRYLPAFFAVAETGQFTEAGKRLHIATSAVSRQVQLLEEACRTQLFFRSARAASLTDAGRKLYEEMRRFQVETDAIFEQRTTGSFKVGVLEGVLQNWLLSLIDKSAFLKNSNLEIRVDDPDKLIDAVESGGLDVTFFSYVNQTHIPSSLKVFKVLREEIVLISKNKISIDDIKNHPWICYTLKTYIVRHQRKNPSKYLLVNNMSSIVELVRKGVGIAMVPSHVIGDKRSLHIQTIKKFSNEYVYLVTRKYDRQPQFIKLFIDFIRSHAPDWAEVR